MASLHCDYRPDCPHAEDEDGCGERPAVNPLSHIGYQMFYENVNNIYHTIDFFNVIF